MSAIEEAVVERVFRPTLPSGTYDLVIVSLVHQTNEILYVMALNIQKYVRGRFLWVVHCNADMYIDENSLPDFVWLVRNPIKTTGTRRAVTLTHGICRAIEFAVKHVEFTNVLLMSSGSAFYREYTVPTVPRVGLYSHELLLQTHCVPLMLPVPIDRIETASAYIMEKGSTFGWQYQHFEKDLPIHHLFHKFKWIKGSQWSGIVFPYAVAKEVSTDMKSVEPFCIDPTLPDYSREEIVFSTYAYNYALTHGLYIDINEAIIDWGNMYNPTIQRVQQYRAAAAVFPGLGHIVCRIESYAGGTRAFLLL